METLVSANQSQIKEINRLKATLEQLQKTDEKASLNARLNSAVKELRCEVTRSEATTRECNISVRNSAFASSSSLNVDAAYVATHF